MKKQLLSLIVAAACALAPLTVRADMYDQQKSGYAEVKMNTVYKSGYNDSNEEAGMYRFVAPKAGAYSVDIVSADSLENVYTYVADPDDLNRHLSDPTQSFVADKGETVYLFVGSYDYSAVSFKIVSIDAGINTLETIVKPAGESVKLTVDVFNGTKEEVQYAWYDSDYEQILEADGSDSLTINVDKNTLYFCSVNIGDLYFEKMFDVLVDNGLEVWVDEPDVEYNKPYTVKPDIKAKDMNGMTYNWYYNDDDMTPIEGANGPTYTIPKVDHIYDLYFEVIDRYGNNSGCYFRVYPKLLVRGDGSTEIPQISVEYNGNATITADYKILGNKVKSTYWDVYDETTQDYVPVKENSDKLELKNIKKSDTYFFNVVFENGDVQFLAYDVVVNNNMELTLGEDVYIKKGDNVDLKATIKGVDLSGIKIRWSVQDISESEDGPFIDFDNNTDKFSLTNVQSNRRVTVTVIDKYQTEYSDEVDIIIGEKPTPTAEPTTKDPTPTTAASNNSGDKNSDIKNFVDRIYKFVLDREPEEEGANFWADELYKFNRSGAEVAQGFIFSEEFINRKTSDKDFVTILYKTFFDREPEEEGFNYWVGQLSSGAMDRTAVANGFIFSQEWADTCAKYGIRSGGDKFAKVEIQPTDLTYAFVERMYTTAMKRESDKEGKEYWAKELSNFHCSGEFVGAAFFLSEEMANMKLDDNEFVNRLYATFMDREADSDGLAYWVDVLSKGADRSAVVFGFTRSAEFTDKCIEARILPY